MNEIFIINEFQIEVTNSSGFSDQDKKMSRRLTYDPYAPGIAEKYGLPGGTDPEGFDPYADTVGPGIYSGRWAKNWSQDFYSNNFGQCWFILWFQ